MSTLTQTPTTVPGHRGEVVTPDHPAYESLRAVFNGSVDRRPALIARAESAGDVQSALRFARDSRLPFTTRAGGHSLAGFSSIDDGLVIDVRGLKQLAVDPVEKRVRAGAG